jgi:large conductance mechanosensitive channel
LIKQNVLALAIAVVVGVALNALVKAVVDDFIMPIIAVVTPSQAWRTATLDVGPVKFGIGDFLSALLNFIIIGLVAWRISKAFIREAPAAPTKTCPFCRMKIDEAASRCPNCTSALDTMLPLPAPERAPAAGRG